MRGTPRPAMLVSRMQRSIIWGIPTLELAIALWSKAGLQSTIMAQVRVAIATNGLGKSRAGHSISKKLEAAKRHGFEGVEVAFECLEAHSQSPDFASHVTRPACLRAAARDVREAATHFSLEIIALNPFGAYDGLADENDVKEQLEEAELWLQLCDILQAQILQVKAMIQHGVELGGYYVKANHLVSTGRIVYLPHKEAVNQRSEEDSGQHAKTWPLSPKSQQDSGI